MIHACFVNYEDEQLAIQVSEVPLPHPQGEKNENGNKGRRAFQIPTHIVFKKDDIDFFLFLVSYNTLYHL